MRPIGLVVAFLAALAGGLWWFGRAPGHGAARGRQDALAPATLSPASSGANRSVHDRERPRASAAALRSRAELSGDERLEQLATEHLDELLLLREAIHHQLFVRGGELVACGAGLKVPAICWIRFHARLRGQLLSLTIEHVRCESHPSRSPGSLDGVPPELGPELEGCVRRHAEPRDPLGVPAEVAERMGGYEGPLDVPFSW